MADSGGHISVGDAPGRSSAAQNVIGALQNEATVAGQAAPAVERAVTQQNALIRARFAREQAARTPGMAATGGGFSSMGTTQLQALQTDAAAAAQGQLDINAANLAAAGAQTDVATNIADIALNEQAGRVTAVQNLSTDMNGQFEAGSPPSAIGAYVGGQLKNSFNLKNADDFNAVVNIATEFAYRAGVQHATPEHLAELLRYMDPAQALTIIGDKGGWDKLFAKDGNGGWALRLEHKTTTVQL